jgi:tungstate transport system ATP-binding protein
MQAGDAGGALLTVDRLRKSHGGRVLFDIASLRLERASAYVLTGVNGAGKSTLLRILAGLEQPDRIAGAGPALVDFDGRELRLSPYPAALRQSIVYVHQHPIMFSTSVAHNIGYGLLARGVPKAQVARQVEEAMAWAGLGYLRGSDPARLSGGEKQRVALARARVLGARLLLLDEPTANLDGAAREQVIALIPTLTDSGSSVVMACHDRDLIGLPGVQRLKLRDGGLEYR